MATTTVTLLRREAWLVILLLALVLASLDLMSNAVQNSAELSRLFVPLLFASVSGLAILVLLIAFHLVRLVVQYRREAAGSRLTVRMVMIFMVLSLAPVSVVYYYSLNFLLQGIDSWFDVQIDQAMQDALELSQSSLGLNERALLKSTERALADLEDLSETGLAISLAELREQSSATEMALMDRAGKVIASSMVNPTSLVPEKPSVEVMQQLREGSNFVGLSPKGADELRIRVVVNDPSGRPLMLQGIYPTSERIRGLTNKLEHAHDRYRELAFLRNALKINFVLVLSLVLLFSLLAAVWAAFYTARRLVTPITNIAEGTRAVADGDYDKQLPLLKSSDELGFLVSSFNAMTRRISLARDAAARSQAEVEAQRRYLETVLGHLSSGVMAFDAALYLRTANTAAHQILGFDLHPYMDRPFREMAEVSSAIAQFVEILHQPLSYADQDWRKEVTLFGVEGHQVLLCRIAPFALPDAEQKGHVLVFDDITTLIKAQRDAAWGEVARRLAHEIKNPLTPIQLSAERLRRKYLRQMPESDARVLDRATHTIVQQVEAMKTMVNAFSDYARPPQLQREPLVADDTIAEVMDLYPNTGSKVEIQMKLDAPSVRIKADPVRLRQVVHNLVKNAQEALAGRKEGCLMVSTRVVGDTEGCFYELKVMDTGPGFDQDLLGEMFEPYVTTKTKGTGLGLAIVKKIVEEHGGQIWAENLDGGACVILRLPVIRDIPCPVAAS